MTISSANNTVPSRVAYLLLFLACTLLFFLAYGLNLFRSLPMELFRRYDGYSASTPKNTVASKILGTPANPAGELLANTPMALEGQRTGEYLISHYRPAESLPYRSQYGLHGKLYLLFAPRTLGQLPAYFLAWELLLALLLGVALALLLCRFAAEFGFPTAIGCGLLLLFSPVITGLASNLYWMTVLFFLPMVFAWVVYPRVHTRRGQLLFLAGLALLVMLRALCGYEFITSLVLSVATPVLYYEYGAHGDLRRGVRRALAPLAAAMLGTLLAIALHLAQLTAVAGSLQAAVGVVSQRASVRTYGTEKANAFFDKLAVHPLSRKLYAGMHLDRWNDTVVEDLGKFAVHYATDYVAAVPIPPSGRRVGIPFLCVLLWVAYLAVRARRYDARVKRLLVVTLYSLLASLSWAVLFFSHTLVHTEFDPLIFYLPFLPMAYVLTGEVLRRRTAAGRPAPAPTPVSAG